MESETECRSHKRKMNDEETQEEFIIIDEIEVEELAIDGICGVY